MGIGTTLKDMAANLMTGVKPVVSAETVPPMASAPAPVAPPSPTVPPVAPNDTTTTPPTANQPAPVTPVIPPTNGPVPAPMPVPAAGAPVPSPATVANDHEPVHAPTPSDTAKDLVGDANKILAAVLGKQLVKKRMTNPTGQEILVQVGMPVMSVSIHGARDAQTAPGITVVLNESVGNFEAASLDQALQTVLSQIPALKTETAAPKPDAPSVPHAEHPAAAPAAPTTASPASHAEESAKPHELRFDLPKDTNLEALRHSITQSARDLGPKPQTGLAA